MQQEASRAALRCRLVWLAARTAARYRRPTVVFERLLGKGNFFAYLPTLDDVIMSRGGNPLVVGGKIIGAIGVSGGTGSQDDVISVGGVAAVKKWSLFLGGCLFGERFPRDLPILTRSR